MISSLATPATGEPRKGRGRVAAGLHGVQAGGLEPLPDRRDVLDPDPVVLDVLAVGDVGGVAGEVDADRAERADGIVREQRAVGADPHHEELVVELLLLEHRGLAAVEARSALRVEPHPPEPAAQVGRVDRGEAALGVGVEDPVADVERAVVLLGLLVLVQRLGVAERPLALAALGARDVGVGGSLGGVAQVRHQDWHSLTEWRATLDPGETTSSGSRGPAGSAARDGRLVSQECQHIMLRVRPKSTWRRTTR